jgi:hypothetical protein
MASLLAAGMQSATWLSALCSLPGWRRPFFSSRLARTRTRATKHEHEAGPVSGYTQCQQRGAAPLPNPVLGAAARAAASRRYGGEAASPSAGRGQHRPHAPTEPSGQAAPPPVPPPRATPRPDQPPPGPRGRAAWPISPPLALAALWPLVAGRAAGRQSEPGAPGTDLGS